MERIATGVDTLDRILDGGLPRHAVHVLAGLPGTGKSTLAQQIAFANGSPERPALYLTTLSEPLSKLLSYLQELDFAAVDRIGTAVVYDSLEEQLTSRPRELPARILELIQLRRPGLIVIDSFKALFDVVPGVESWRRLVFELAGVLAAYDATTLLVGEYGTDRDHAHVELAVADGIIELCRSRRGTRDERFLRIAKLRGSRFLDGDHAFVIGRGGLRVFPRLLGPQGASAQELAGSAERLRSGVRGLDEMIHSGWLRGTSTVVVGRSGSGKTLLGLHFLRQGVADGEPSLLVGFQESAEQIRREMRSLGWDTESLLGPRRLDLLHISPIELQIDSFVGDLFARIDRHGVKRLVIDALGDLERSAADRQRFSEYLYALTQHFARRGVASMLILEGEAPLTGGDDLAARPFYVSDNLLLLEMSLESDLVRTVRILKTRSSGHDGRRRTLRITEDGLEVSSAER